MSQESTTLHPFFGEYLNSTSHRSASYSGLSRTLLHAKRRNTNNSGCASQPKPSLGCRALKTTDSFSSLVLPWFPGRMILKNHTELQKENMVKLAKKVEQQKKFPNEQQIPQAVAFPVLPELRIPHSLMEPIAHINMQQLFIFQSRLRESKRIEEKYQEDKFLPLAIFNCHFYKKPSKSVRMLKPNGVTGIYWWSESQTNPASLSSTSWISLLLLKSHTALSGAGLQKKKCTWV